MKNLLLLIIVIGLLFGCAGVKRGVQDNLFYSSSNPKMNVLINADFKYAESKKETELAYNPMAGSAANVKTYNYLFINQLNNRLIEIQIHEIITSNWFWRPGYLRDVKNKIDSGDLMINGEKYEYCVAVQERSLGSCMLNKYLCRTVGGNSNYRIFISYSQYIEGYSLCKKWVKNHLTSSEKEYLKNFIADSEKDFTILDYQDPTSATSNPE
jgi:hypothetical protein